MNDPITDRITEAIRESVATWLSALEDLGVDPNGVQISVLMPPGGRFEPTRVPAPGAGQVRAAFSSETDRVVARVQELSLAASTAYDRLVDVSGEEAVVSAAFDQAITYIETALDLLSHASGTFRRVEGAVSGERR